ncbi:hypothetical protein REPUB_Repub11eG0192400 [Reevesia pubescens]
MMNLCKLLAAKKKDILIAFVVTEEWLGFIGFDPKPDIIRFEAIPNIIPPERLKAANFPGFYEAVMTKMGAPFELLLDRLELPVTAIIGDIEVRWSTRVGNRRKIPVALSIPLAVPFLTWDLKIVRVKLVVTFSGWILNRQVLSCTSHWEVFFQFQAPKWMKLLVVAGLQISGVRYLWVARGEASRLKDRCCGDMELVIPWCDQLKVLCHP